ncbi:MAG TPA: spore germination protein GerW family protein [Anaerolineae bacterium]|nr:spore germination protein GerW family protein [Anaerolineae bacterium]
MKEDMQVVLDKLDVVTNEVNVDRVFGKPQQYGDRVVIPVATMLYGVAIGGGEAEGNSKSATVCCEEESPAHPEVEANMPVGSGVGGAGGAIARPVAYIEIDSEGVRVKPIMNEQVLALAGICLGGWAIAWFAAVLMTIFGPRDS